MIFRPFVRTSGHLVTKAKVTTTTRTHYTTASSSSPLCHTRLFTSWTTLAALYCLSLPTRAFSYYSKMNFITERDGRGTITMTPKNEADQSALLVICHGLGDTSDGFDDVAEVRA